MTNCKYKNIYNYFQNLHIFFWIFVVTAWIFPETALFNILVLIPLIYLIHILPQHPLNAAEDALCSDLFIKKNKDKGSFEKFIRKTEEFCTYSPLTYQGFLIFGFITSILSLYFRGYIKLQK